MLHKLIKDNKDLLQLLKDKYEVEIKGLHLFVHNVPYVNADKKIERGTLVAKLQLANNKTVSPGDHVAYFTGDHPCNADGSIVAAIRHQSKDQHFEGVLIRHSFSASPAGRQYLDYHEMITRYVEIISAPAQSIDSSVTAKTGNFIESQETDSVFVYPDTNSSKAEIELISSKLQDLKIGIIGLGGTGSYVLDFVSKTYVKEIHIFDEDHFLNHNAFRAPGAAPKELLENVQKKVHYLHQQYSNMHKGIVPHDYQITEGNVGELDGIDFVFVCIDKSEAKNYIFEKLVASKIPFIDTGIDVLSINEALTGCVRVTMITPGKSDHIGKRISRTDGENGIYGNNIQIAELNALNASLAVIKWKKFFGFYHDLSREHNAGYEINLNKIFNDDVTA